MGKGKKGLAVFTAAAVFMAEIFFCPENPKGADRELSLVQVQNLAIAKSGNYQKILGKIEVQDIKYAAAVKSIKMKQKNMSTFRWTPLLSFKFPEKPTLADEYEWRYKPLQITAQKQELVHQLSDDICAVREKVSLLYVEGYITQEKISFQETRLLREKESLKKQQAKNITGKTGETEIKKAKQSIEKITLELSLLMRSFDTVKEKISEMIEMDISLGYSFSNPFVEAEIPRELLDLLVEYTLEHDQSYYESKMETQLALIGLNMSQSFMQGKYGSKLNQVMFYVNQAKEGKKVDEGAFKRDYNTMLKDIDAPWNGTKRILFIKIQKEWFKGAVDGSRYVEDDPYVLYTQALEYVDARKEQESKKKELTRSVKDGFENIVTAQLSYSQAKKETEELFFEEQKAFVQNRLGMLELEDLEGIQEEYITQELNTLEALGEYTKLLYSFDRLTCGGITQYLSGTNQEMNQVERGSRLLAKELSGKVYYYLDYKIEDNLFSLGISVPPDYSLPLTHFSLFVEEKQIGEKTEISKELTHLALDLKEVDKVQIHLFCEDKLEAVCDINPEINQEELVLNGGYTIQKEDTYKVLATYSYRIDDTGMARVTLKQGKEKEIAFYQLTDSLGNPLAGGEKTAMGEPFSYLSLLVGQMDELKVNFYDKKGKLLYTGVFEEETACVIGE